MVTVHEREYVFSVPDFLQWDRQSCSGSHFKRVIQWKLNLFFTALNKMKMLWCTGWSGELDGIEGH